MMTTAALPEAPSIKPKDIRAFTRPVSTALMALVNNRGVKYRVFKDGNHLVLYPPDRSARPCKISAHRSDEANIKYLSDFVDKYLGPLPSDDRPAKPEELAKLTLLNTSKPPEQRAAPEEESAPEWRVHHRDTGEPTTFETNGTHYRCTAPGCSFKTANRRAIGPHAGTHKSAELAKTKHRKPRAKPWAGTHPASKTPLDAERIRELRRRSGKRWQDIGSELGITAEGIRQWLARGETATEWVEPFAKALGVTTELLLSSEPLPNSLPPLPEPEPTPEPVEPEPVESEPTKPAPVPTMEATGVARDYLSEIARLAHVALGREDLAGELERTRAELARTKTELDEANARLLLLREAWEAVGK